MYFEVEGVANKVSRKVWNLEDALGMVGGLMSLITVVSQIFMNPFVANNIIIHIAGDTAKGNTLNIDSVQFFLRKILYDLFGKLFSGSKSFKE